MENQETSKIVSTTLGMYDSANIEARVTKQNNINYLEIEIFPGSNTGFVQKLIFNSVTREQLEDLAKVFKDLSSNAPWNDEL